MQIPNVNILLSTYNGAKFIDEQIQSLLSQVNVNITITIRDDGSNTAMTAMLKQYQKNYNNIQLILGNNIGLPGCFFELMKECDKNYDYYAFCDQDDIWIPNKLEIATEKLKKFENTKKPAPTLYFSRQTYINENGKILGVSTSPKHPITPSNALFENLAVGCTCVFNNTLLKLALMSIETDKTNQIFMHDWWLYLIASTMGKVVFDKTPTIKYRQHSNNKYGGRISLFNKSIRRIKLLIFIQKTNVPTPLTQLTHLHSQLIKHEKVQMSTEIKILLKSYQSSFFSRLSYITSKPLKRRSKIETVFINLLFIFKLI